MSEPVKRYNTFLGGKQDEDFVLLSDHERAMAEKDAELKTAREYLAHMHNTEECLAKAIAENEELTVTLASLKARCEGMREALKSAYSCLGAILLARENDLTYIYIERCAIDGRRNIDPVLATLPVEGVVERVAGELFAYVVGDDIDRTSPSLRDEYMTEAAKIIRLIGGTR